VKLPAGEERNEWMAANSKFFCFLPALLNSLPIFFPLAVDFFNEIRLIWDIICEIGVGNYPAGRGFPAGFEYRWAETKGATPTACSGPQYVEHVLEWTEKEMNNEAVFPISSCKYRLLAYVQSLDILHFVSSSCSVPKEFHAVH
jgi:MOB kinase activator 1